MSTLVNSIYWDHSDMTKSIVSKIYYDILSRSGSTISVRVYCAVILEPGATSASRYGYNVNADITVNGSSNTLNIKGNETYDDATLYGGGPELSSYVDLSFTVGTSSGSLPVSGYFYSTSDPNSCKGGPSLSGSIPYDSTNTAPTAPSSISPNSGYYTNSIPISWGASSDAEGNTIYYNLLVAKNTWGSWIDTIPESSKFTGTSYNLDISGDPEGTRYFFGIRAIDTVGASSAWTHQSSGGSATVYKNRSPISPSSVSTDESFAKSSTTVRWPAGSDPDGHSISYKVNVYRDGVYLSNATVSAASYVFNFPAGDPPNTIYTFGVITIDSLGFTSSETKGGLCRKVTEPNAPVLVYPTNSAGVCDLRPRIAITIKSDPNGKSQILYVTWNSVEYNSKDNSAYFSRMSSNLSDGDKLIFKPASNASIGNNNISIRTHNGYFYSSSNSYTIKAQSPSYSTITPGSSLVLVTHVTELRNIINTLRQLYGLSSYAFTSIGSGIPIRLSDITEMQTKINEIIDILNTWDSTTSQLDVAKTWPDNGIFMTTKYFEDIKTKLNNL